MPSKSSAKTEPKALTRPAALSDGDGRREARRLDRPLSFSSGLDGFSGQEAPDVVSAGTDQILSGDEAAAKRARLADRRRAKRKQEAGKSTAVKKLRRTGPSDEPGVGGGGDGEPAAELGSGESTSDGSSSGSEESSDESEESDHQDEDDEDDEGYGETGFKDPFTCEFCPEKCLESKSQLEAHLGSKVRGGLAPLFAFSCPAVVVSGAKTVGPPRGDPGANLTSETRSAAAAPPASERGGGEPGRKGGLPLQRVPDEGDAHGKGRGRSPS
ncbi:MAG: hypothetical protein BJ554DRAFT_3582 [Olpidium bornovanus]|uniref:Uncharacterized protein n=1 Tax=Olpidium bornovanus TaxID=278681 RepID=A0A8H7ZNY8_9FUNG|nr:MAG: hypothetical protein BJ554DRAFT_3582 [Olpidium bornovanus]